MALITYTDKDESQAEGDPRKHFVDDDANEIKAVVNTNRGDSDSSLSTLTSNLSSHASNTSNPHSVTKTQVGLGNADNTSDANKPVSTAQQTALDLKANLASPTFTGTPAGPTASPGTNTTQFASTAFVAAAVTAGADAKVADAINNGTTTIAPSQNAVFDALQLKADADSVISSDYLPYNLGSFATGDGVTDDRAAIQDAYDDAYTAGSRVFYLPRGTYLMSLSTGVGIYACFFIKPGTVFFGDGDATIIKRDSGDLLGVTITYDKTSHDAATLANRNYTLSKFKILGTTGRGYETPIGTSETEGGIFLATATNRSNKVVIEHVSVENLNKESIAVWGAVECTIRNNRVYNCNFDAYNPQLIESLILTGNYAYGCNIGCEYDGRRISGVITHALIEGNEFVNVYEYGISIEAGDNVKISNNLLVGQTGSTTVTSQSIGIYLLPNQGDTDLLEVSGNTIVNFIQGGLSNSTPDTTDYVYSRLMIKGNTFLTNGENCIRLKAFSVAKILHTDIEGNSFINWNRIDNGSSAQWSAIHIEDIDNVSIHGNTFRNVVNGRRNDPLYIYDTTNVRFFNNDCTGPVSEFFSSLDVRTNGTNTGFVNFGNIGLQAVTGANDIIENEVPTGSINSSNTSYTIANTPISGSVKVYWNGMRMKVGVGYTISGTTITMTLPPDTGDTLVCDYRK